MSSPKVLLFTTIPWDQAVSHNREACNEYMELATIAYSKLRDMVGIMNKEGSLDAVLKCPTPAEARAEMEVLFHSKSDGSEALRYAHTYWQDLKHKWGTPIHEKYLKMREDIRKRALTSLAAIDSPTLPDSAHGDHQGPLRSRATP